MNKAIVLKFSALVSGVSGLIILAGTVYPIISYEAQSRERFTSLISPVVKSKTNLKIENYDYTQASNWFVGGVESNEFIMPEVSFYTLSIPKLNIENATVAIGGEDLSKNLIQYPGTALPGKRGNAVVFGHSILPRFYDPENYLAIFSTIPTLVKGDEIKLNYDGISYVYRVEDMFEVFPTDIQVLEQDASDSFITLVTCVPPGDPRKPERLIIRARVVPPG